MSDPQPRPQGVFWARTGPDPDDRHCTDARHPVTERDHVRPKIGAPGETEEVEVWCCAVCWVGEPLPRSKGEKKGARDEADVQQRLHG